MNRTQRGRVPNSVGSLPASPMANFKALAETSVHALFPCLVFGVTFVQQEGTLGLFGQGVLWMGLITAALIVLFLERATILFFIALAAIVVFRGARIYFGELPELSLGYNLGYALLFGVAGASVLVRRPEVLHRQVVIFVALSVPAMLLQLYGEPYWAQGLRTDIHGYGVIETMPALFLTDNVSYSTIQARPAGLVHANNFLSIIVLYVLAVHFALWKGSRLSWKDTAVALIVVLAMAKIVFLTLLMFTAVYVFAGPQLKRLRMLRFWLILAGALGLYYLLFPGIFNQNLSPSSAELNFSIRLADLRSSFYGEYAAEASVIGSEGEQRSLTVDAGSQSGYSFMAKILPATVIGVFLVAPFYLIRLRTLKYLNPVLAEMSRNGLIILFLSPLVTVFFGNPFFAFSAGAAFIPFLMRPARLQSAFAA